MYKKVLYTRQDFKHVGSCTFFFIYVVDNELMTFTNNYKPGIWNDN